MNCDTFQAYMEEFRLDEVSMTGKDISIDGEQIMNLLYPIDKPLEGERLRGCHFQTIDGYACQSSQGVSK